MKAFLVIPPKGCILNIGLMGTLEPNQIYSKKQTNTPHEPSREFFKVKCTYGIDADKHHPEKPILFTVNESFQQLNPNGLYFLVKFLFIYLFW